MILQNELERWFEMEYPTSNTISKCRKEEGRPGRLTMMEIVEKFKDFREE